MKRKILKAKKFTLILFVMSCLFGITGTVSAQNLINKAIDKSPSGSSSLLGATTFSLADDNNPTSQPNFTISEVFTFSSSVPGITLNSIYANGYSSWETGGTLSAPRYAVVSNPNVLNSSYKSISDGTNRLIVRAPNKSTEMFRFSIQGHKPGQPITIEFTMQEITSNTVGSVTPQLIVNVKEVGGNDYNYYPKLAQGGTMTFTQTVNRNSQDIEIRVSRDNWNDGDNFVYAFSDIKVYGTSYLYIDALNSNVCDGDNITLTAKGFDSYIGDYLWESATSISGPFTTILGETQSSISINAPLGNTYYRVSRGTSSVSEVFQLNAKVCCKETSGQRVIFKEEFGTVPSGTRKNFADIGSTGVVPLTYKATGNVDDGQYAIVSRNNDAEDSSIGGGHPWYWAGTDHTGNTDGGMLFINCGNNIKNKPVYVRTLDGAQLCNSTYLFFSVYMANPAKTGGNPSRFRLEIWGYNSPSDSTLIESLLTGDIIAGDTQWKQFGTSFLPGTYPELKVKVISLSDAITGNDVIIDDISVTVCAPDVALEINGSLGVTETSITCGNTVTLDVKALTELSTLFSTAPYYRWEESIDNGVNWTNTTLSGQSVTSAIVTQSDKDNPTIYRVIIAEDASSTEDISNGLGLTDVCATFGITNDIKVSCTQDLTCPTITNNTIAGAQTICNGGTPSELTGLAPTLTPIRAFTYQWQSRTGANPFTDISLATGQNYTPTTLTTTTEFRRILQMTGCPDHASNDITITVQNTPTAGAIAANQTICNGAAPATISNTTAGTGSGAITYKWEQSTTDATSGFSTIAGQTGATYSPGALTQTTWFRRTTVSTQNSVNCESAATTAVQITVQNTPTAGAIATNQTICNGATPAIISNTTTGTGSGAITYKWEQSTTDATSGFSTIAGQTGATYSPGALTQTTWFRRTTVSTQNSVNCESAATTAVQITVQNTPTAGAIATNQTICNGATPAIISNTTTGTGSGAITYKWEQSTTDATSGFSTIAGQTAATYAPGALTQTTWFRRTTVSTQNSVNCESAATATLEITVNPNPNITSIVSNCTGGTLDGITVNATISTGTIEYSSNGGADYQASNVFSGLSLGTGYTFVVRGVGTTCTASETFTASCSCPTTTNNTIQDNQAICNGDIPAELTGIAPTITPATAFTYQWQSKPVGSGVFTDVSSSGTSINYSPAATTQSTEFRRLVKITGCPNANSNIITITVNNAPTLTAISAPSAVCSGSDLSLTTPTITTNGTAITAQEWEMETAVGGGSFSTLASPFTVTFADNGKAVRYTTTNACGTTTSNEVTITVNDVPTLTAITTPATVCSGDNLALTTPTITTNGTAITAQEWEMETAVGSTIFATLASPFTVNYTDNGKAVRYTTTNACGTTTSNEVTITVNDVPTLTAITTPATVCSGDNLALTTPTITTNGTAITAQEWEMETAVGGGSFSTLASPFTVNYTDNGKAVRYTTTNACGTTTSNEVTITVNDVPTLTAITTPATVCSGDNLALTTPTITTNGTAITAQEWEMETAVGGGSFSTLASPFTVNYTDNGKAVRYTTTNACGTTTSNEVTITVNDVPTLTAITTPATVCSGDNLALTTPTITTNGTAITAQEWEMETAVGGGSFSTLASPFTVNYTDNGKAVRYTTTNACGTTTSNEVTITVNDVPTLTAITTPATVCSGDNLALTTPTITANGSAITAQEWEMETAVGSTIFATLASPFTVNYTDNGKAVRYTTTNACGTTTSNEVTITVNDVPTLTAITTPATVCSGDNLALTTPTITTNGTAITAQEWEMETAVGGGSFSTLASPFTVNYTDNGKAVRYTTTNACGTTTSNEVTITVNDVPTLTAITTPATVCSGDNLALTTPTITTNGTAITAQEWEIETTVGGGSFSTLASPFTVNYTDNGKAVRYTTTNACGTTTSNEVTITVNDVPNLTVIPSPSAVCSGSNLSLTAPTVTPNGTPITSEGWELETSVGSASFTTLASPFTVTFADNGKLLRYAATNICGTTTSNEVAITVYDIPSIITTTPNFTCGEGTVLLEATASLGTIHWYEDETTATSTDTGDSFTTPILTTTTTYYIDATENGCTTASRTAIVATVRTIPTITSVTPGERCGTGTVDLSATASAGVINWYAVETAGASLHTDPNYTTASIAINTTYYVDATHESCTTLTRTPVFAMVKEIPTILNTTPGERCGNGTVVLSATPSVGAVNWYESETATSSLSTGDSYLTNVLATNTTFYVDAISNGCISPSRTAVTATIKTPPVITDVTPGVRCGSGTVTLGATANEGIIQWFKTNIGGTSEGNGDSFTTPIINNTTTYYVESLHNGCTSVSRTAVVASVKPIPVILTTTPAERCGNGTVRLSATANEGTINWYSAATGGVSLSTQTSITTPSLTSNTSYYVDATLDGCTSPTRTPILATIKPLPARPTAIVTQPTCTTYTGNIVISNHVAGLKYSINGSAVQDVTSFANLQPGRYLIAASNVQECASIVLPVTVNETSCLEMSKTVSNPTPNVSSTITFTLEVKNNGPSEATNVVVSDELPTGYVFIQAPPTYNTSTKTWNIGNIPANGKSSIQITARVNYEGDYVNTASIIAGDDNDPDKSNNTATASTTPVHPLPQAVDDITETNTGVAVNVDVTRNDSFGAIYTPSTGSTVVTNLPTHGTAIMDTNGTPNNPTDDRIIYTPENGYFGDDTFEYTITNYNGDISTAVVTVMVSGYVIPDGFSPNEDGINDTFVIQRSSNLTINLIVFNRWGNKVFEKANYANDWDGTGINNQPLPEGTYYRIVEATNTTTGNTQKLTGVITLKR